MSEAIEEMKAAGAKCGEAMTKAMEAERVARLCIKGSTGDPNDFPTLMRVLKAAVDARAEYEALSGSLDRAIHTAKSARQ